MSPFELYGLILSGSVLVVAVLLFGWHRVERRRSLTVDPDEDANHFARQDRRRRVVAAVMLVQSALILVGSRTPHKLHGRPNPLFIAVWLTAFVLVLALLALALVDWYAIRAYARRQRLAIVREGMEVLKDELLRRSSHPTNGRAHGQPEISQND